MPPCDRRSWLLVVEQTACRVGFRDPDTGELGASIDVGFWPHEIEVSPDYKTAYVSHARHRSAGVSDRFYSMGSQLRRRTGHAPGSSADGRAAGKWQMSTAGGVFPVWNPDGRELYYLDPAGAMMTAPISVTKSAIEPGTPIHLFSSPIVGGGVDAQQGRQYDVAPDGRFLINTTIDNEIGPITLLMNWRPDGKR